jgi:TolB-like protein
MSFFEELKRRNVFRVGAAYLVIAWLLLQLADIVIDNISAPEWVIQIFMLALLMGLPLALFFAWAFELTPEGLKKEKDVDRTQSITHVTGRKLDFTIIFLLAIGLVYFLWESRFADPPLDTEGVSAKTTVQSETVAGTENEVAEDATPQVAAVPQKSIAVLPFVNMSDDAGNEYFSDGVSEEILNALAKVRELKVAGRTSSFAFKGQNQDLRQIGETLGVKHILEGSVRKSGNQVRITAQLIKVDDGFHLWSDSYDRELDNVFAIQDEIASAILVQLKAHLMDGESAVSTPVDTEAYELYLLARQRIYERTAASIQLAIDLLNEALAIDDSYPSAWALKGLAIILFSEDNYGSMHSQRSREESMPALERALELDPGSAEALAVMGLWHAQFQRDHSTAIDYYRRALAINPSLTDAGVWYASSLATLGDVQESIAIGEQLFSRDPLHPSARNNLAVDYVNTGQPERSLAMAQKLEPIFQGQVGLKKIMGEAYQAMGQFALASGHLSKAVQQEELNNSVRSVYSQNLMRLMQWDELAEHGSDQFRSFGLNYLDRIEEALLLETREVAENGPSASYFQLLVENERHQDLIRYIESRWTDLSHFERENPEREGYGANMLGFIAQSYGIAGQEQKFVEAMALFTASLDAQIAMGIDNGHFSRSRAFHAMLSGDRDSAVALLDDAFQKGITIDPRQRKAWPVFHPLNGDRRYEEAKTRMLIHLNNERAQLGLEPVTT